MVKREILGQEIWEAETPEEARQFWSDHPDDRHQIWTTEEIDAHMLDDPAQIAECLSRKQIKPGRL